MCVYVCTFMHVCMYSVPANKSSALLWFLSFQPLDSLIVPVSLQLFGLFAYFMIVAKTSYMMEDTLADKTTPTVYGDSIPTVCFPTLINWSEKESKSNLSVKV